MDAGTALRWLEPQASEITGSILPALLHLDADLVDMAALFSGEAFGLPQFPIVLIRGGLAADSSGAFGYETLRSDSVLVAFDGEWQFPAITEQRAFQLIRVALNPLEGVAYAGFPWASLIDHLNNGTTKGRALLAALEQLLPHLQGATRRITVCRQIFFLQHRWIFERAGITDVFWPHATIFDADPSLRLHPFPLFAVQWQAPANPES